MNTRKEYPLNFISISRNAEAAVALMIEMAQTYDKGLVPLRELSRKRKFQWKYAKAIAAVLTQAGYLKKDPEKHHYMLSKNPAEITLGEILSVMDGAFTPAEALYCYMCDSSKIGRNKKLKKFFEEIMDLVMDKIEKTSIKDLSM